ANESPFEVRVTPPQASRLMNVGNVKKWFAASLLNTKAKEAKEYKQYINQNKNLVLTPTLTDNNDPALTSHSDYHVYNAYMRRANLPNPITDIRVPSTDERVYEENLVIPKQYAVLQAVGSDQYTNSVAKSRYQAYETWLKTGKLVGTNNTNNVVNTKSKNNVGGNGKGNISKKEKEAYKDYKEKMKECQIKE
ncbi:3545_t:CDS:2, partial [Gigaspora rosea]